MLVIIAFVAAWVATLGYVQAGRRTGTEEGRNWLRYARGAFLMHSVAVLGIIGALFTIIYNHYYEYHYAWSHSSNNLPTHYMISCFWEGQEGSFLLWIFWHVILGITLIFLAKSWEKPVMAVFSMVQAFLVSMILGVVFFESVKIGSSPFALLRDVIDAPIFAIQPDFVPEDGTGLNPLLQNYWMVIHPPTLFLGFAATLVPFAFCMAGLGTKKYKEWVKPALPWAQFAALILGIGIMMGAYWAYETLNFGGYWNWDPVENAVYIPWLILVAAIHVMITFRKKDTALKAAMVLTVASFLLILYATFLTRSGVLGEASVHSFTDLGLSGQLLIYLLAFAVLSIVFLARAWKDLPSTSEEVTAYSREFWIFMGATTLGLAAFQVLVPTSIPVWNSFINFFGGSSNLAPPADQVVFYTRFQLWFGVAIAILSGTGQFFWWKKMDPEKLKSALMTPLILTMLLVAVVVLLAKLTNWKYIVLLTAALYSIVSNTTILLRLGKANWRLSGGSVTHIGVALMLIGILFSSGTSNVLSINYSGLLYNSEFPEEMNREHLLLFRNEPRNMEKYQLVYKGPRMESADFPGYIDQEKLVFNTSTPYKAITREDLVYKGKTYAKRGEEIHIYPENVYYEVEYRSKEGDVFSLYPRIQYNPQMGAVPSPDIVRSWNRDVYTHITNLADPDAESTWSEPESYQLALGDTMIVHDYIAILDKVERTTDVIGVDLGPEDVAVYASIRILGRERNHEAKPIFLVKDRSVGMIPATMPDLGLKIQLDKIDPQTGTFTFGVQTTQKDWIIMKAVEMPYINLLWIGTLIMSFGFCIAIYRRYKEFTEREKADMKTMEKTERQVKKLA